MSPDLELWDAVKAKPTTALDDYIFDVTLRTGNGSLLHSGELLPRVTEDSFLRTRSVRLVSLPLPHPPGPHQVLPWWLTLDGDYMYHFDEYFDELADSEGPSLDDDEEWDREEEEWDRKYKKCMEYKEYKESTKAYAAQVSVRKAKTGERSILFDDLLPSI